MEVLYSDYVQCQLADRLRVWCRVPATGLSNYGVTSLLNPRLEPYMSTKPGQGWGMTAVEMMSEHASSTEQEGEQNEKWKSEYIYLL